MAKEMEALGFDLSSDKWISSSLPIPVPGEGEVRVKVYACGLNPVDAKIAQWKGMIVEGTTLPVPGLDVMGEIDAVGPDVDADIAIGELVLYHGNMALRSGGFAEFALHDALTLVRLSKLGAGPQTAATLAGSPCAAWTAYRALHDKLRLAPSDSLLIVGASGGVGSFALQMARIVGCRRVIAICSEQNSAFCRHFGATEILTRSSIDEAGGIAPALQRLDPSEAKVNRILDCVGETTAAEAAEALDYDGIILPLVSVGTPGMASFGGSHIWAQLALGGAHSGGLAARRRLQATGEAVTKLILSGDLEVPLTKVIQGNFDECADVLTEMLKANSKGKMVLQMVPPEEQKSLPHWYEKPSTLVALTAAFTATCAVVAVVGRTRR